MPILLRLAVAARAARAVAARERRWARGSASPRFFDGFGGLYGRVDAAELPRDFCSALKGDEWYRDRGLGAPFLESGALLATYLRPCALLDSPDDCGFDYWQIVSRRTSQPARVATPRALLAPSRGPTPSP